MTHKRLPAETNLVRKLLMSEAPELKELFIIRVDLNDRKIIDEVIQGILDSIYRMQLDN